jgi:hypothetical protein
LEAPDLLRPFHGVRQRADAASDPGARLAAYGRRMPGSQFFSHATAALLHGMPLPTRLEREPLIHVSVFSGSARPNARGVRGHVLQPERCGLTTVAGLRTADPGTAWCQLAGVLGVDDLVAAGDFLVTGDGRFGRRAAATTVDGLLAAIDRHDGCRGVTSLRRAIALVRPGPLSRRESLLRLDVIRGGLPEPVPNHVVVDARGRFVAMVDLAFVEYRVALEYQSDLHRPPAAYRADLERLERLADAGWVVVQITADGVTEGGASHRSAQMVERVRRRLRAHGWPGQ